MSEIIAIVVILVIGIFSFVVLRSLYSVSKSPQIYLSPGTIICTSVTKPIPAEAGTRVYEVDTNRLFVSDGENWLPAKVKNNNP